MHVNKPNRTPMIRPVLSILLLSLLGPFFLNSCCPEDPFVPTPPPQDPAKGAYLRVILADPDLAAVNALINDSLLFAAPLGFLEYPTAIYEAQFWPVDTAARKLAFALPGGTEVASIPVSLPKGSYHTAYLYRRGNDHVIMLTTDLPTSIPAAGEIRYRLVNMTLGSPGVDITFSEEGKPDVRIANLAYGDTTELLTQPAANKTLTVTESATGRRIISMDKVPLSGGSVITLALTGRLRPTGDQRFLYFNIFNDSYRNQSTNLYGNLPIPFNLVALRFINLVGTADAALDLTLQDSLFGRAFPDFFRRNFAGQREGAINVASLGTEPPISAERGYFFLSTFLYTALPYRVEIHEFDPNDTSRPQDVLVPGKPFPFEANRRYTVVAFGPFIKGEADAVTIFDRTPGPPAGGVNVRFFHGAFGPLQAQGLRLRVNGITGPPMNYGESPDPESDFFTIPAALSATVEVLNESGGVVHTQTGVELKADRTYTVLLSRGPTGNAFVLKAISDDVVQ